MILETPCCGAQSCTPQWLLAWAGCSWLSQPLHTGTGLPAAHTAPPCLRAALHCSQKPCAAERAISHLPSWRPSPSSECPPVIHSALLRSHTFPFCENNNKPHKEAMKKAFSVAARRALCEQTHQTCKQQVVHPVFVFHLQQRRVCLVMKEAEQTFIQPLLISRFLLHILNCLKAMWKTPQKA